jgi:cellulose synthase/poly-beta-1,6-N-acetylglucosamine synthase-like glycosyltransferase
LKVIALIPAHNEEDNIALCINALKEQDYPLSDIYVIADNCTDDTQEIAESLGAFVFPTHDNKHKKAGALNQVLNIILPWVTNDTGILVVDADSFLDPTFVGEAVKTLESDSTIGGCGGTFRGRDGGGLVGYFQRNEYARYARDTRRQKGKVLVLTGTATLFPARALKEVIENRRHNLLPGEPQVYDTKVLTEDNELSLALLHLNYKIKSPKQCTLTTEIMESWKDLSNQRLRWKRGALENIMDYGITKVTLKYWGRQLLTALGCIVTFTYLLSLLVSVILVGTITVTPFWLGVTGIFVLERVVTVKDRGFKHMAAAGALVVEMIYDTFLQWVHVKALAQTVLKAERSW